MSFAFGHCRRNPRLLACAFVAAASIAATAAKADTVNVMLDQARVMKLPERVATIVIGNPLIADASLQAGGILILTGKGYGSTNLVAFDRSGRIVLDKTVQVLGAEGGDIVVVYRGVERESYSCAPECERRLTLGDSQTYFNTTLQQGSVRSGLAQAAPK
ncbi:MAG: pilus assembly protein N-terminal domain-containing protein [Pseudolabrys sp.]|jgi:hypothetical protein